MRFGVYFERILKIKWLFSYRNNYNIVTRICFRGLGAYVTRENFENVMQFCAFWCLDCVLKNSLKINIFWIKNNYYSYTFEFGYNAEHFLENMI